MRGEGKAWNDEREGEGAGMDEYEAQGTGIL